MPQMSSLLQRRRSLVAPLAVITKAGPCGLSKSVDERSPSMSPLQSDEQVASAGMRDKWLGAYKSHEKLAEGSAAVVYRAERLSDSKCVALKCVRSDDEEVLEIARKEFEVLKSLQHPCIIKVYDFIGSPMGTALVMEYFPGCNLMTAVRNSPARHFEESIARVMFLKLAYAVEHMHSREIVHRDIKAENVLVSSKLDDLRLIDFNVAACATDGLLTPTGTVSCMPPEVLLGDSPSAAGDIWAVGLCLHLMLRGKLPLDQQCFTSRYAFAHELRSVGLPGQAASAISDDISREYNEVLQCCFQADPGKRSLGYEFLAGSWTQTADSCIADTCVGA